MRYRIDASRSRLVAQAFARGLLSAFGHNPRLAVLDFDGLAEFDPAAPESASVRITARADSLVVIDDMSEKDRREIERVTREELLESSLYPTIVFQSSAVMARQMTEGSYNLMIAGALSLCDVTREFAINATAVFKGDELRARGEFPLSLSDFNIRPISVAGGLLKLRNEVKIAFDIMARALR